MKKLLLSTTTVLAFGTAAFAQDFYIGAAIGVTSAKCEGFCAKSSSTASGTEKSLLAGMRFDIGTKMFAGVEVEAGSSVVEHQITLTKSVVVVHCWVIVRIKLMCLLQQV